jgi:endonuclease YncB( thermonuclease family)
MLEPPKHPATTPVQVVRCSDGDSFTAIISDRQTSCRLYGVDAPELGQHYGQDSMHHLRNLIELKTLPGRIITYDCYGRVIVDLWAFTTIRIAVLVLRAGMGWHTPRWSPARHELQHAMDWAREGRIGLWHDPHPVPPWTWRREQGHRTMAMRTSRRWRIKRP